MMKCRQALEEQFLPHRNYGDLPYVSEGNFWQQQMHIYLAPFYYIDYVLAQICAFQIWLKHQADPDRTLKDYLAICEVGGSQSFREILNWFRLFF